MTVYKVYTASSGRILPFAIINPIRLSSGITIPAVSVGEEGAGRKLSYIPLNSSSVPGDTFSKTVIYGSDGSVQCLIPSESEESSSDACIVVLPTPIGHHGWNNHTGDSPLFTRLGAVLPIPGHILTEGRIAQGTAGRMGSGSQLILLLPKGKVLRVVRNGPTARTSNKVVCHYYAFDGEDLHSASEEELLLLGLF